jgi:hypothetical protein
MYWHIQSKNAHGELNNREEMRTTLCMAVRKYGKNSLDYPPDTWHSASYRRLPGHGYGLSAPVHKSVVVALVRTETNGYDENEQPCAHHDQADGQDHELHAGEDEGDGAVGKASDLLVNGGGGHGEVGHDHVLGEDAGEKGGFVN